VLPFAKSLDTLGFFTHTPADMLALWQSLGYSAGRTEDFALGAPDPMPDVEPAMAAAFQNTLSRLRSAGASMRPIDIAGMLARLSDMSKTVMFYEGALASTASGSQILRTWFGRASRSRWSGTTTPDGISRSARREWLSCIRPHL
jgi:Asp-tRNA(Asn)/Glu-tRNA(Gln) amidotransferase A subunit family amidase